MEIEVVSRETIKPSIPTPDHLKTLNLSFFDQSAPPIYVPTVLFYGNNSEENNDSSSSIVQSSSCCHRCRRLDILKKSFIETLTRFYPFAGRIESNISVDCNDQGVEYVESKVSNYPLSELIQQPNLHELAKQFLLWDPFGSSDNGINVKVLLAIQVTVFEECGGIVIGCLFSHKIADASSIFTFIDDWATTVRKASNDGQYQSQQLQQGPDFKLLQSLFPQRDELKERFINKVSGGHTIIQGQTSVVIKKFVFGASKIAELKKKSITITSVDDDDNKRTNNSQDVERRPLVTRVQAVSALIWKCFIDVDITKKKKKEQEGDATAAAGNYIGRVYSLSHVVNLRTRMVPPVPTNSIGIMTGGSIALCTIINNADEILINFPNLVRKVRESIKKIDNDYVTEFHTGDSPSDNYAAKEVIEAKRASGGGEILTLSFTSWCGFGIYEKADFGWGKPTWVRGPLLPFQNTVWLMDTASSGESGINGIEAWVTLSKQDMAEFERHPELCLVDS